MTQINIGITIGITAALIVGRYKDISNASWGTIIITAFFILAGLKVLDILVREGT